MPDPKDQGAFAITFRCRTTTFRASCSPPQLPVLPPLRLLAKPLSLLLSLLALLALSLSDPALPRTPAAHLFRSSQCGVSTSAATLATPTAAAGPYSELLDLERAPLLWLGVASGMQGSAHEREGDFSGWLYEEAERLYFFDQAGPLCTTRSFYAASGALADRTEWRFFERAELHIEVDGALVLTAPAEALFNGSYSAFFPFRLALALPGSFARSGNLLQAPLCAASRLRLSWAFPLADPTAGATAGVDFAGFVFSAREAMLQIDTCVADDAYCFLKQYFSTSFVRFPGASLPTGWHAFDGLVAPVLPASISVDPLLLSSRVRLAAFEAAAAASASDAALTQARCSHLSTAQPLHSMFLAPAPARGTVLAMLLDFPDSAESTALAHSWHLTLEARWDGGAAAGGGELRSDLASLFGPPTMGVDAHVAPMPPSAQWAIGTLDNRTVYITFPAPFWRSANVTLALSPRAGSEGDAPADVHVCSRVLATARVPAALPPGAGGAAEGLASAAKGCGAGLGAAAGAAPYAGYLQGTTYDWFIQPSAENIILSLHGVAGKLIALTSFLEARRGELPSSVVEGDVRAFVDGARSPAMWDSGYEDFFGGAHTYEFATHRAHEALFAYHRVDTLRYTPHTDGRCSFDNSWCGVWMHQLHPDVDLFSLRTLLLDAVPFQWSLQLSLEGFSGKYGAAQARGAALYYGAPAPRPPAVTDTFYPAVEVYRERAARRHTYSLEIPLGGNVTRYDLASAFAGAGEPVMPEDGSCPVIEPGAGAAPVAYHHCPAPLLVRPALALPHGSLVRFFLALDPAAPRCALRRVIDVALSVQRAELRVEGMALGTLASSDRAYGHLNTRWREALTHLPPAITRGRSRVTVELLVALDGSGRGAAAQRAYPGAQRGEAWSEVQWEAVCYYL